MRSFVRGSILVSSALGASVSVLAASASCVQEASIVARASFIRCESAQVHWDAAGGDQAIWDAVERELAQSDPRTREQRRQRMLEGLPEGRPLGPQAKLVAVVNVQWRALTTVWIPNVSTAADLVEEPREINETVHYCWHGPPEDCDSTPKWALVDLWITGPCCDTPIPSEDGCLVGIRYAQPAPAPMRDALAKALDGR